MTPHPLHILSISQYGSGMSRQGEQFSGALARQRDYATYVKAFSLIVPSETGSEEPLRYGNLTVYPVVSRGAVSFARRAYTRAVALSREHQVSALMVDNPFMGGVLGVCLKVRLRIPLVVHSMSDMIANPWYRRERVSNRIKALVLPLACSAADVIRVSTVHEVERLAGRSRRLEKKVMCVPFYIDREEFLKRVGGGGTSNRERNILFVGRLSPQKDVATLLRAFALAHKEVGDATLTVVGDGPERERLETLAGSLGVADAVQFAGRVAYDEIATHFGRASVFVIASLHEGTCMVLHEAAAARLPIVATRFAGAIDFIRGGEEGYTVPIRDHARMAAALVHVLNDDAARVRMGERASARLTEFSRERALAAWDELCVRLATL